ncbi:hypothetical protein [Pelomonas sp. KK5]|uniref:N-acyl amino acid synthase FeeM domain-containing protein n=1 Tax=Pelomonas sp. KK5 TaxID=1855730 RepID=UPI001301C1A8|nr:hypothetical protein [Pelomonas sp. KK5]
MAEDDIGVQNRLPFRISVATRADIEQVADLRATTYGRHLPELGERLAQAEAADFEPGCEVLVARSKLDDSVLGTLRIHSNVLKPLPLEASYPLPPQYEGQRLAEATRLCVKGAAGSSLVRNALFKAFFNYCQQQQVDWLLAVGRRPVDRLYDALLFSDVGEAGRYYPMAHVGNVAHRVMSFLTEGAEPLWMRNNHPLYGFVFLTDHPDIDLSGARSLQALADSTARRAVQPILQPAPHLSLAASNGQSYLPLPAVVRTAAA